jgi:hypothetical protein
MKLRLSLAHEDLADRFGVTKSAVSAIFTTWIKVLSQSLKNLIHWSPREAMEADLPVRYKTNMSRLVSTIDCTEVFLEKPRELLLQAHTWSDYKKHNTAKVLVSISPRGRFNFVSLAYGGRASDRYITQNSGYMDNIQPYDQVMADNGFTNKQDFLLKRAELIKPPPAQGREQAPSGNVKKPRRLPMHESMSREASIV